MGPPGGVFLVLLIGAILIDITTGWEDGTPPSEASEQTIYDIDIFRYDKVEYLMLSEVRTFHQAYFTCDQYSATLAYFETVELAQFVAEALSETRFVDDTLWVAGVLKSDNLTDEWYWHTDYGYKKLRDEALNLFIPIKDIPHDGERECLGFGRLDNDQPRIGPLTNDQPQLRPLACNATRNVICQRPHGNGYYGGSTHPGWIKIGQRLYKIYADLVNHERAEQMCTMINEDATLAVVKDYPAAQTLGRHLLYGRPSLKNAWIGAKYTGNRYRFEAELQDLDNITDAVTIYPPWRYTRMLKPGGCLLLDRHLATTTVFAEARCTRERPFICYRFQKNESVDFNVSDVIIGNFGYRLVRSPKKVWAEALLTCKDKWGKYNAKLVEIDVAIHKTNLLYSMGGNKSAVAHIWIGGRYNTSWKWVSNGKAVDQKILNFVQNQTYEKILEQDNTCLNMDRENHISALHYGANCKYAQAYVCVFPADKLRKLQRDETKLKPRH